MKLLRIKLENWRGVESREIQFDDGVTIIEGPNEIGKTTLIEALRMLIKTLDSSGAAEVKAIKPVGEDIGSSVEAEIHTGQYHFTYSKQYNRKTGTTLNVTQPKQEQHTGREAHAQVLKMLDETMDRPLWESLLVDQGSEIAQARLRESHGLARSLDDAAGTAGAGDEDPGLMERAEEEYSKYFTPTGQSRIKSQEVSFERTRDQLEKAQQTLDSVDNDLEHFESAQSDARRLKETLPELQINVNKLRGEDENARTLASRMETSRNELEDARQILTGFTNEVRQRESLVQQISQNEAQLECFAEKLKPLEDALLALDNELQTSEKAVSEAKSNAKNTLALQKLVNGDVDYWQNHEALARLEKQLKQLDELKKDKTKTTELLKHNRADNASLEKLRLAESALKVAEGQRQIEATRLEITAIKDLAMDVNSERIELAGGQERGLKVTAATVLNLPDLASITITPPTSVDELEEQYNRALLERGELLKRMGEKSYAKAQASNQLRNDAESKLEQFRQSERQLLDGDDIEELGIRLAQLTEDCTAWLHNRPSDPALPADRSTAQSVLRKIDEQVELDLEAKEAALLKFEQIREQRGEHQWQLDDAKHKHDARQVVLQENQQQLAASLEQKSDDKLQEHFANQQTKVSRIDSAFTELEAELKQISPEAVAARFDNARNTYQRAERELSTAETQVAILKDRLDQAQANGRYEELESAQREHEEAVSILIRVTRRAHAIDLLFGKLKEYRDNTHRAYVAPLKQRIEELGRIVFGGDFSIELGEDWTLISRTLDGQTIPFTSLSVGTREQLGILTRLAVAQIVSAQGGVPLIIDDALGFSDPARLTSMGAAIAHAGENTQILLLTCTPGRFTHVGNAVTVRLPEEEPE